MILSRVLGFVFLGSAVDGVDRCATRIGPKGRRHVRAT
jgi:hypothetical protein